MERKKERKKKMGDRAWHVSTRKLGSTARPEKREYIYIYIFDSQEGRLGARGSLRKRRERERERVKKGGGEHPLRHLEVNGTAKVYFVAEKTGCHATMGPVVGVQRAPRDQEGYGHRQKGPSRSGETRRTAEEERQRGGEGNIAAAAAAAAVAVSAPLRVTLEGAHRRTVAQATGAPVALKFSFLSIPSGERGIIDESNGKKARDRYERMEGKTF